jgi:transposase InsO family protein
MNEEKCEVEKKQNTSAPRGGAPRKNPLATFEQKLRAVKLHLEEGFTQESIAEEMGMSSSAVYKWSKAYRELGEEGLKSQLPGPRDANKLPEPVRQKILELKKEEPTRGIKRISQLLRRVFFLKASSETVRRTLKEEGLVEAPPKARRNLVRPRFFERATPNQMWQSDIFTFRLGGRYAYLIGFMDDYSRFMVGADIFRSHTAENVLEVFRVAAAEYQPPKEMLTDNGREYINWRGITRFQAEMKKNGTHHFKSRPHHPMTLGKIERFWETIWQEFLSRAQFESFESARERIRFWIKYYNHKRPHQGIEGLCPADRYFEIASQLRKTIEAGIKENLLEMALRGQPRAPFYMVGRMEGQSVVLRAEKGKLKLSVSDNQTEKELVYDLNQQQTAGKTQQHATQDKEAPASQPDGPPEGASGALAVDRVLHGLGTVPPLQDQLDHVEPLARPSAGGDAPGAGTAGQAHGGQGAESPVAGVAPETTTLIGCQQDRQPTGAAAEQDCQSPTGSGTSNAVNEPGTESTTTGSPHSEGSLGPTDGHGSGPGVGDLQAGVLPVGTASSQSDARGPGGTAAGPAAQSARPAEAGVGTEGQGTAEPGNAS